MAWKWFWWILRLETNILNISSIPTAQTIIIHSSPWPKLAVAISNFILLLGTLSQLPDLRESTNLPLSMEGWDHTPTTNKPFPGLTSDTIALSFYGGFRNSLETGKPLSENTFSFGYLFLDKISLPARAHRAHTQFLLGQSPTCVRPALRDPRRGGKDGHSLTCV